MFTKILPLYKNYKMCCRLNKKQNGHLPCHMSCGCEKAVTHLNTSALTPVILDIKLKYLCNLYSYWAFKYLSL